MSSRILIVDDDSDTRTIIDYLLSRKGFSTAQASQGGSALELLQYFHFDAAVIDIDMPEVSGVEVSKKIHSYLPIVMVSSNKDDEFLASIEGTYEKYIDKNKSIRELPVAIRDAINSWNKAGNC